MMMMMMKIIVIIITLIMNDDDDKNDDREKVATVLQTATGQADRAGRAAQTADGRPDGPPADL